MSQRYRVECNHGSKYFEDESKAWAYFYRCKNKHLDAEIWLVNYNIKRCKKAVATQELVDYTFTNFPKN